MSSFTRSRTYVCIVSLFIASSLVLAQQPQSKDEPEVIRVTTELVQTGVVVLDKQGKFVDGLKPEQFVLKVDGKPVTPAFFERVTAGTLRENKLEHATKTAPSPETPADASYRGRTVVFFIDDLHLSAESVNKTRSVVLNFIDNQMGPEDRAAIASASGQLGFLQQLTDVKPVLRAAISKLTHKPYTVRDAENITMTEYQAIKVDQGDKDATDYFTDEMLKATNFRLPGGAGGLGPPSGGPANARPQGQGLSPGMTRESAAKIVKERALSMLRQASAVTTGTLASLESLMRSSAQLPGRKLVFFVSDGFYLNDRNTAFGDKLKQITDAAVRSGVVIYALDARGLVSITDVQSKRADGQGRLSRANLGELTASQDGLNALAGDTGGRALFNSEKMGNAITDALRETSNYYLLAWRPSADEQKTQNFKRIEVTIPDRPELSVRLPRGFYTGVSKTAPPPSTETAVPATKGVEGALINALSAASAREGLPTQLSVGFLDVPGTGPVLTTSMQMATSGLGYGADGKQPAAIDLAGVILNDQGKQAGSFKNRLTINPSQQASDDPQAAVIYSHKLPLKPGLYQVRVAARDDKSGRVGSNAQWIEIPDLQSKQLTLSTLMVGGQFIGSSNKQANGDKGQEQLQFSVDRRFARGSHLNFLTIIYNAAGSAPDLEAQIKLIRNGQAVVTSPLRKVVIEPNSDLGRIVYGADIALQTLPVGRYVLSVTVNDKIAKTSATQQVLFDIE